MIPDILIGNVAFLEELSKEEREIFEEGFELVNRVERKETRTGINPGHCFKSCLFCGFKNRFYDLGIVHSRNKA